MIYNPGLPILRVLPIKAAAYAQYNQKAKQLVSMNKRVWDEMRGREEDER
jgi:hypothetical protein